MDAKSLRTTIRTAPITVVAALAATAHAARPLTDCGKDVDGDVYLERYSRIVDHQRICRAGALSLIDSQVTGNMQGPDPGSVDYFGDIVSCRPPKLDDTSSCGTSRQLIGTQSWGTCSLD